MGAFIPEGAVKVHGIKEIQAALKALDGESQKLIKAYFDKVADPIIAQVKAKIPSGPPVRGHIEQTGKSTSQQREGRIRFGQTGKKAPYYPWLDFGGTVGKNHSVKRNFIKSGRYLYPTITRNKDEIRTAIEEALVELLESVDWTVKDG